MHLYKIFSNLIEVIFEVKTIVYVAGKDEPSHDLPLAVNINLLLIY